MNEHLSNSKETYSKTVAENLKRQQHERRKRMIKRIGLGVLGLAVLAGLAVGIHLIPESAQPPSGNGKIYYINPKNVRLI